MSGTATEVKGQMKKIAAAACVASLLFGQARTCQSTREKPPPAPKALKQQSQKGERNKK
jgi:hypothetical protein